VLGIVIGLLLVGFHAIQGPRLDVPQMVQSRGQFGFYGAVQLPATDEDHRRVLAVLTFLDAR